MGNTVNNEPLRKLAQAFERLDLEKRKAAAKWLEGVIVSQILSSDERESIVKASNEYTEFLAAEEYESKVDDLIEFLRGMQKSPRNLPNTKQSKADKI